MDGAKVDNVVVACLPCALRNCAGFWADEAAREEGCWDLVASHEREGGRGRGHGLWAGQREVFEKNKSGKKPPGS